MGCKPISKTVTLKKGFDFNKISRHMKAASKGKLEGFGEFGWSDVRALAKHEAVFYKHHNLELKIIVLRRSG